MDSGRCGGCRFNLPVYMGDGDELLTACVYILRTGHKRPCPPGEACGVFEPVRPAGGVRPERSEKFIFGKGQYI